MTQEAYIDFLNAYTATLSDEELRKIMEQSIEAWKSYVELYKDEITDERKAREIRELEYHLHFTMHFYMDAYGARKNYERRE